MGTANIMDPGNLQEQSAVFALDVFIEEESLETLAIPSYCPSGHRHGLQTCYSSRKKNLAKKSKIVNDKTSNIVVELRKEGAVYRTAVSSQRRS
jgi:hypothetical protein